MRLSRALRKSARTAADIEAIAGGPKTTGRRIQNRLIGRAIGKATWRLWRRS
jgi:hypothetical protein